MPAYLWILLGLASGVALIWGAALALCHQGTVILRWTHQEDEVRGAPRTPRRPAR